MKKFSTLLLTGKAASLPFLIQQAQAEITPTFANVTSAALTQIQHPVSNQVKLDVLGDTGSTYGSTYGAATICSTGGASQISVTLTGLKNGDTVILATSTTKGGMESYSTKIQLGATNLKLPVYTQISADPEGTVALTVPVNLTSLGYPLTQGSTFYMQSIVFPSGAINGLQMDFARAKVSELDVITVGSCSTYGGTYGGTY
jgi:hypothetical protein